MGTRKGTPVFIRGLFIRSGTMHVWSCWIRGLYRLADAKPLSNPDFVSVALKVPRGVIYLISALAFHQMTTQIPHAIFLAIEANESQIVR